MTPASIVTLVVGLAVLLFGRRLFWRRFALLAGYHGRRHRGARRQGGLRRGRRCTRSDTAWQRPVGHLIRRDERATQEANVPPRIALIARRQQVRLELLQQRVERYAHRKQLMHLLDNRGAVALEHRDAG